MRVKELELRARVDGRGTTLADELDDDAAVLVDGHPVEPGQVIVLRQVREGDRALSVDRSDRRGDSTRQRRRA